MEEKLRFYKNLKTKKISIVLIFAKYKNQWLLVKHKARDTYEICGGHVEPNETIYAAAKRELYEESGATIKELTLLGFLSKTKLNTTKYCAVFKAEIKKLDPLPNFEMESIKLFDSFPTNTTYPEAYKRLSKYIV